MDSLHRLDPQRTHDELRQAIARLSSPYATRDEKLSGVRMALRKAEADIAELDRRNENGWAYQ